MKPYKDKKQILLRVDQEIQDWYESQPTRSRGHLLLQAIKRGLETPFDDEADLLRKEVLLCMHDMGSIRDELKHLRASQVAAIESNTQCRDTISHVLERLTNVEQELQELKLLCEVNDGTPR